MQEFELYRYYKGERKNPFVGEKYKNNESFFWDKEYWFDERIKEGNYLHLIEGNKRWMDDYDELEKGIKENKIDVPLLFKNWLHWLFVEYLPSKYGTGDFEYIRQQYYQGD
jgi:hypothetical protein